MEVQLGAHNIVQPAGIGLNPGHQGPVVQANQHANVQRPTSFLRQKIRAAIDNISREISNFFGTIRAHVHSQSVLRAQAKAAKMLPANGFGVSHQVNLPGWPPLSYSGQYLKSLHDTFTPAQRLNPATANQTIHTLEGRILAGRNLFQEINNGTLPPGHRASRDEVESLMLFFDARARASGSDFVSGAFNIEDANGRIADFLDSSDEKYLRSSSHIKGYSSMPVPPGMPSHFNQARGIDFPKGEMPGARRTLLYQRMNDGVSPQRIFLKMETAGCRLSANLSLSGLNDASFNRPLNIKSDIREFLNHSLSFLSTRGMENDVGGQDRKERLPSSTKKVYTLLMKELERMKFPHRECLHAESLKTSRGVRSIIADLHEFVSRQNLGHDREAAINLLQPLLDNFKGYPQLDHLDVRIGNEQVFSTADLQLVPQQVPQQQSAAMHGLNNRIAVLEAITR